MPNRREVAEVMSERAAALIELLEPHQRAQACWPFPSDEERRRWFYTPTDHGGLALAQMTGQQQRAMFRLMASGLSTAGYVTASAIIGLENILDHVEGFVASFGRDRGRDPLLYFVRIFGHPGSESAWGWRIGGHHVSLSFTVVDGEVVGTTPLFFGADPASAPLLGPHPHRPLAGVEDLARELTRSLDPAQQTVAVIGPRAPTDLVGANRSELHDGDEAKHLRDVWRGLLPSPYLELIDGAQAAADAQAGLTDEDRSALAWSTRPKGLAARSMSLPQREMLVTLLRRYTDRLPDGIADAEAAKFDGDLLGDVHLLWAGGLEVGDPHYYRLHSPLLVAEYDNTQRGANHVHTVWRDPRGDFGGDVLAEHLQRHRH